MVGPSVIFSGCVVESGARVERSILGPGTVVSSGAVVADSVLMEGCHVARRRQGGRLRHGAAVHRRAAG